MPTPQTDPPARPRPQRSFTLAGTSVICLLLMLWAGTDEDNWRLGFQLTGQEQDYYNLLVDGLLEGRLHMKVAADVSGQLPVLMDASLYEGKYYLYFGIVPALLTFLPYSFLTGHDLPQNLATFLLAAGGFLLNLRLFVLARRRYFPACPGPVEACSILLLALGTGTPILVFDAGFYEVALAGGYLCISAVMLALYLAVHGGPRAVPWLAAASLGAGLAVGCRPTYVLVLPVLLLPLWRRLRADPRPPAGTDSLLRMLGAAVIPAGIVGLGLMAYNHGRFGDPFEFGFKYQLNALMSSGLPFASAGFIRANLDWYYLTPPVLSPYFPYVLPINASLRPAGYYGYELIHGQWLVLPLSLTGMAGLIWAKIRRVEFAPGFQAIIVTALLAFGAVFAALLTFGFRANRYVADFQPCLILALALIGGFTAAQPALAPRWTGKLYRLLFCGFAVALSLFNYLVGIQWMDHLAITRPQVYRQLAYGGNYPSLWLHQLGLLPQGPYRFQVTFAPQKKSVIEPLLATGTSGYTDVLHATQHPDGLVQFSVDHKGYGGLSSALVPVRPGTRHLMEVDLGSFYPPKPHPIYRHWHETRVDGLKLSVRVLLDGEEMLQGVQKSYDSPPHRVVFGQNPGDHEAPFSGRIGDIQRLPSPLTGAREESESGLWRLELEIPGQAPGVGLPLLASGISGKGNLLLVEVLSPAAIRFGLDEWGTPITYSPPLPRGGARIHRIEIFVGPQVIRRKPADDWHLAPADLAACSSQLQVWFDGRLAWQPTISLHHDSYSQVSVGINTQGFSTATGVFPGPLKKIPLSDGERRKFLLRCLQAGGFTR